jgi:hypothetical protein
LDSYAVKIGFQGCEQSRSLVADRLQRQQACSLAGRVKCSHE